MKEKKHKWLVFHNTYWDLPFEYGAYHSLKEAINSVYAMDEKVRGLVGRPKPIIEGEVYAISDGVDEEKYLIKRVEYE